MLNFHDVSVSYGNRTVLEHISFTLTPGRITVLLGSNGAGKSTLLRCVNGMQTYTGRIFLQDTDLKTMSSRERAKHIGILPQILPQTGFSCRTLVSLGRNPYTGTAGRLSVSDRNRVQMAMETAGTAEFADRHADTLSGGEKQKVFLAMLLAQDPSVMLFDEPCSFLDTAARGQVFSILRDLAYCHGKTVLLVLHDLSEALEIADDVLILAERTIVFSGSRTECLETEAVEKWFGVKRYFCTNGTDSRIFFR
ncbi:MAG: ABC transporter ATP-binding protein [Clostridia bacterium]|nr:ABC transporter ATP-binding protein [Clostridia bacterium]